MSLISETESNDKQAFAELLVEDEDMVTKADFFLDNWLPKSV